MAGVIELVEKTESEIAEWLPAMKAHYVEERVAAGEPREQATASSDHQFAILVPDGRPAEGQHVMNAVRDGEAVGQLWTGRPFGSDPEMWFVFFVEVDPQHRGKGLGREIMLAAEAWTRANGGRKIGLNVFGPNAVARSLYDSLGYEVMATNMVKDLG